MTWFIDVDRCRFDAYDDNETQVATDRQITDSWAYNPETGQIVDSPQDLLDLMDESMQGNQPSAYNQQLLRDAMFNNITSQTRSSYSPCGLTRFV